MGEERLRVLRLVADGKVSPEEAVGLLEALDAAAARGGTAPHQLLPVPPPAPPSPPTAFAGRMPTPPAQRLRVLVRSEDGDEVDLACPLGVIKGIHGMLPEWARDFLDNTGIDLQAVMAGLDEGAGPSHLLKVRSEDGDEVQISLE